MEDEAEGRFGPAVLNTHVLILNKFYTPINVVNVIKAFALLCKEVAEIITIEEGNFNTWKFDEWLEYSHMKYCSPTNGEQFVRTPRYAILVPRVLRLTACTQLPQLDIKFTKKNIFIRDDHRCMYCGKRYNETRLTIDHVVPRSRGGQTNWTNVVTACIECNSKKSDRYPWEAGMKLVRRPMIPRKNLLLTTKMRLETRSFSIETKGNTDSVDITRNVRESSARGGYVEGQVTVHVAGSTAAVTTIEYEEGLLEDLKAALDKIAPRNAFYRHHEKWNDDNGHSHIRSALLGTSIDVPFANENLLLGTWQQIVLIDFDTRPRTRDIIVQIMGRKK